jgi:hypothetical protein
MQCYPLLPLHVDWTIAPGLEKRQHDTDQFQSRCFVAKLGPFEVSFCQEIFAIPESLVGKDYLAVLVKTNASAADPNQCAFCCASRV